MDLETEKRIRTLTNEEFADSTILVIAHHLNTIMSCERVLVLSYGKQVEFDSPAALMQNGSSEFKKLISDLGKQ